MLKKLGTIAVATAIATVGFGGATATVQAEGIEGACLIEDTIEQTYGLTLEPSRSNFHSIGKGTITCEGSYHGVAFAGPGTFRQVGHTDNTWCAHGTGVVTFRGSIPMEDGSAFTINGSGEWTRAGTALLFDGTVNDQHVAAPMAAQPLDGDCVSEPVKHVTLRTVIPVADPPPSF